MTDADKTEFAKIMTGLAENFSAEVSTPGLEMRFRVLCEFSIQEVSEAAIGCIRNRKYTKMPTVAELLEYLGGGRVEDKAMIEATKALEAIKAQGPYVSVVFDNPTTQAVIKHSFGGWVKMCEELTPPTEKWFLKDFAKAYEAFSREKVQLYGVLPGLQEIQNGGGAFAEYIPLPVLLGDKVKSQQVLEAGKAGAEDIKAIDCTIANLASGCRIEQ